MKLFGNAKTVLRMELVRFGDGLVGMRETNLVAKLLEVASMRQPKPVENLVDFPAMVFGEHQEPLSSGEYAVYRT